MARVTEAHVEARRNQILDAAWSCFARRGYHQTTMQDIATDQLLCYCTNGFSGVRCDQRR